jgi:hypothetical protein
MSPNDLIGRRVRVIAGELMKLVAYHLRRTRKHGDYLEGTVTHVEACGESADEGDVRVQIDGLAREYVFGPYQLEILPSAEASHQGNGRPRNSHWPESPVYDSVQTRCLITTAWTSATPG